MGISSARITFLGAAQSVTGSRYLLEAGGKLILVDCGLYQERSLAEMNWKPSAVPPDRIDAVLLTHAHLDHCGLLPRLFHEGFRGPIHCTGPTAEMARIVMADSARIQVEDVENKKRRHEREGRADPRPAVPLYTVEEAEKASSLFRVVGLKERVSLGGGITAEFFEAGHILGSASIRVSLGAGEGATRILFSGDIGRWNKPILNDPDPADGADYILMESTYGDRLHGRSNEIEKDLEDTVLQTVKAGGNLVIPSFAIERSQEVLFYLNALLMAHRIPHLLTFLDSPMATSVTEIFTKYPDYLDSETLGLIRKGTSPFEIPGLAMTRSSDESKAINRITSSVIIIAGAGMCTGGRIKHHLIRNIPRPESTILFVGYQAVGTLGREIQQGARQVRILGETFPVRARIRSIEGFSAHADRDELLRWAGVQTSAPRRVFITHGEPETAEAFRKTLTQTTGWNAVVPSPGQSVELS